MDPRQPLPDQDLENDVQRSAALLLGGKHEPAVVLRALVISVQGKLQPQSAVDAILSSAPPVRPAPSAPPSNAWYGNPNRSRPAGVPDPGAFGPQSF